MVQLRLWIFAVQRILPTIDKVISVEYGIAHISEMQRKKKYSKFPHPRAR